VCTFFEREKRAWIFRFAMADIVPGFISDPEMLLVHALEPWTGLQALRSKLLETWASPP